jgi:hypothetical protein
MQKCPSNIFKKPKDINDWKNYSISIQEIDVFTGFLFAGSNNKVVLIL